MRKVKARLLVFNNLDDSDSDDKPMPAKQPQPPPVTMPPVKGPTPAQPVKKRESKWGKASSSEPSAVLPVAVDPPANPTKDLHKPNL